MEVFTDSNLMLNSSHSNETENAFLLTTSSIVFMVTAVVGVLDNAFVIVIMMAHRPMRRNSANIFIMHQSVIDALGSLVFLVGFEASSGGGGYHSLADELYCRLWKSTWLQWVCYLTSIYNLVALNFDRWLKICHPLWHKVKMTRCRIYCIFAFVWFLGIVYNTLIVAMTTRIKGGLCSISDTWPNIETKEASGVICFMINYVIPVSFMLFCYIQMLAVVRRSGPNMESLSEAERHRQEKKIKSRNNIFKTMCVVTLVYMLCWFWPFLYYMMVSLGRPIPYSDTPYVSLSYDIGLFMCFINLCANPFIYIIQYEPFKKAVRVVILGHKDTSCIKYGLPPASSSVKSEPPSSSTINHEPPASLSYNCEPLTSSDI